MMSKVPASKLMQKAKSYEKKGQHALAREAYMTLLHHYPNNENAKKAIQKFRDGSVMLGIYDPPAEVMSRLINLYNQRYFSDAYKLAKQLSEQYPRSFHVWNFLGVSSHNLDDLEMAEEALRYALKLNPDAADICNNLGNVLKDGGRNDEAIEQYERAIKLSPTKAGYYRNLSMIKRFHADDELIKELKALLTLPGITDKDKCEVKFALAKAYEDTNEIESAFRCLIEGNAIRKRILQYNIEQDMSLFARVKSSFLKLEQLEIAMDNDDAGVTPVFIVGMPRSGTSLIEQIITCHSDITGAGELDYISRLAMLVINNEIKLTQENIRDIRKNYLGAILQRAKGNSYVSDKAPQNFRFLGLMCIAFPDAKIIHVRRDRASVCWSNFKQHFTSNNLGYSCDLDDVARYYHLYEDLMEFWCERFPERIFEVDYEKLVTDQETETRKLIDYLELQWDEKCLEPEKNKRSVRTASQEQVRRKVYSGSQNQWRKYEPFINGAFDSLISQ